MKYVLFFQDLGLTRKAASELLEKVGCEHQPLWNGDFDRDKVRDDVEILVTAEHHVGADEISPWPNLEMLSLAFTGYNDVDMDLCRELGLHVYYVPGYSTDSVSELTVGLTLSVLRKIPYAGRRIRDGHWDKGDVKPGIELAGKKVAVLGTGAIGMRTAQIFKVFGCELLGWSRTHRTGFPGTYKERLSEIFEESDVIVLHLAVNDQTRGIVSREMIGRMRRQSILINTSRADLVDTRALAEALEDSRIAGAGIDVFDTESTAAKDDPLLVNDQNVVATPHLGFKTAEALDRLARTTIENIGRYLAERAVDERAAEKQPESPDPTLDRQYRLLPE